MFALKIFFTYCKSFSFFERSLPKDVAPVLAQNVWWFKNKNGQIFTFGLKRLKTYVSRERFVLIFLYRIILNNEDVQGLGSHFQQMRWPGLRGFIQFLFWRIFRPSLLSSLPWPSSWVLRPVLGLFQQGLCKKKLQYKFVLECSKP